MPKTLQGLLDMEYGVATRPKFSPVGFVIGNTVDIVADNNPNRVSLVIVNLGVNDLFIGWDREVSATRGILIANGGGGISLKWRDEMQMVAHGVFGIAPVGNTEVYVVEVVTTDKPIAVDL